MIMTFFVGFGVLVLIEEALQGLLFVEDVPFDFEKFPADIIILDLADLED